MLRSLRSTPRGLRRCRHVASSTVWTSRLEEITAVPRYPAPSFPSHTSVFCQSHRHKSVFVSKHNQSLNVTAQDILQLVESGNHRTTNSHVILEECPFCTKPSGNKPDNQHKLYVQLGGGAYFCHRCGTGGSWFDLKARLGSNPPLQSTPDPLAPKLNASVHDECKPLQLPSPRLQALYSSQLLDESNDENNNPVLDYLYNVRGLDTKTLRKYGVGRASYSFQSKNSHNWQEADCVTFPWIMTVADAAYQEELRGAKLIFPRPKEEDVGKQVNEKDDWKKTTFLTRRIKARSIEEKSWQRLDPAGGGF